MPEYDESQETPVTLTYLPAASRRKLGPWKIERERGCGRERVVPGGLGGGRPKNERVQERIGRALPAWWSTSCLIWKDEIAMMRPGNLAPSVCEHPRIPHGGLPWPSWTFLGHAM